MNQVCKLSAKKCVPCEGGVPPMKEKEIEEYLSQLKEGWIVIRNHHLEKEYRFEDFKKGLEFTNKVGEIAEREGHHPDIYLSYGRVKLLIWTHKINGLTESDFIFAAKCDEV